MKQVDWGTKLYRIYTSVVTTVIIPVAIWTFNMYTSFVVMKTEHETMKVENKELKQALVNERSDRIADVRDVRYELTDFRNEYYNDFPKNIRSQR